MCNEETSGLVLSEQQWVVVDGDKYFYDILHCDSPQSGDRGGLFNYFLRRFNCVDLIVKDGYWVPHNDWAKFPREMIWFYGVERLRIMEEDEAEDWKKLPMLLWE